MNMILALINLALYAAIAAAVSFSGRSLRAVSSTCSHPTYNRRGGRVQCGTAQPTNTGPFFIPLDTRSGYNGVYRCDSHTEIGKRVKRLNRIQVGLTVVLAVLVLRHMPMWFGPTGQRTFTISAVFLAVQVVVLLLAHSQYAMNREQTLKSVGR